MKYKFDDKNELSTYSECIIDAPFRNVLFMFTEYDYYPHLLPTTKDFKPLIKIS